MVPFPRLHRNGHNGHFLSFRFRWKGATGQTSEIPQTMKPFGKSLAPLGIRFAHKRLENRKPKVTSRTNFGGENIPSSDFSEWDFIGNLDPFYVLFQNSENTGTVWEGVGSRPAACR